MAINGIESEDALMAEFALPTPHDGIPPELIARLDRIRRCLRLAYVEYELVDVVTDYALVSAELAFALRYKQCRAECRSRQVSFKTMVAWAESEGLLRGVEKKAHFLRDCRNRNVHPRWDSFGGIAIAPLPRLVFEVVNCLFSTEYGGSSGGAPSSE